MDGLAARAGVGMLSTAFSGSVAQVLTGQLCRSAGTPTRADEAAFTQHSCRLIQVRGGLRTLSIRRPHGGASQKVLKQSQLFSRCAWARIADLRSLFDRSNYYRGHRGYKQRSSAAACFWSRHRQVPALMTTKSRRNAPPVPRI
jgi:hypothetical protein